MESERGTSKAVPIVLGGLIGTFDKIEYTIIPKAQNQFTDTLDTLASMVEVLGRVWTRPLEIEQKYQVVHKEKKA